MREDLGSSHQRRLGIRSGAFDWATYALLGIPAAMLAASTYLVRSDYTQRVQQNVQTDQFRRASEASTKILQEWQHVAGRPAREHQFLFRIDYTPWADLEQKLSALGYTGERYAVITERMKNVEGRSTASVPVVISERHDAANGQQVWTGSIKDLEMPNKGTVKSKIDLTFLGRSTDANSIVVTFTQSYSGEDVKGDSTVPAQAPNSFKVRFQRTPEGSYVGLVPHPDLENVPIGTAVFEP